MTYVTPADVPISSSWQDHKNRTPPSKEPGTDFETPYGTDIRMAGNGTIVIVDSDPAGAEGRRLELIMDNGEVIDYLHLSQIMGTFNQKVTKGQTGIALSGASGNGVDWYYGPHVHVTRRATAGLPYADSIDFMLAVGENDMGTLDDTEANYQVYAKWQARLFKWDLRDSGTVPPPGSDASKYGLTMWDHFGKTDNAIAAINVSPTVDPKALAAELVAQGIQVVIMQKPTP